MAISMETCAVPRIDEAIWGLWCPWCLKPSGYDVPLDFIYTTGVSRTEMRVRCCFDCKMPLPVEDS